MYFKRAIILLAALALAPSYATAQNGNSSQGYCAPCECLVYSRANAKTYDGESGTHRLYQRSVDNYSTKCSSLNQSTDKASDLPDEDIFVAEINSPALPPITVQWDKIDHRYRKTCEPLNQVSEEYCDGTSLTSVGPKNSRNTKPCLCRLFEKHIYNDDDEQKLDDYVGILYTRPDLECSEFDYTLSAYSRHVDEDRQSDSYNSFGKLTCRDASEQEEQEVAEYPYPHVYALLAQKIPSIGSISNK